ncbi:ankyrin repeat domain-containing protein [Anaplasma phagocytophilum]|nr:ankyrin repeat domain-containing protein [Anaplasma phagocytophilum]
MHARRNKGFNEFLRDAVRNNDAEGLKKALSDLNGKERAFVLCRPIFEGKPLLHYSLHEAIGGISNVEAVQEIVNFSTADTLNVPDHEGNYPHTLALEAGKEYAQVLLNSRDVDWGISVDNEGNIPFAFAVKNIQFDGNSEIFAQILTRYPDAFDRVNRQGDNILHIACASDDAELLRFCIEKSISQSKDLRLLLEQKNGLGETPLHSAYAIQDNSETSDVLKRYIKENSGQVNVDLSLKDLEKNSVVHTALKVGNRHVLDVCKGDFKSEVEGVISLLEYSNIDLLNNYLDSFSPERKDKLIKHSVKELLDHPQRLIRILALEDEDISNKLIEDGQWRQYLAERAPEYMACWLLSGSDRVDELIPGRLPMGRRVSNITGNEEPCQSDAIRSIVSSALCISGGDKNALDRLFNSRKLPKDLQLEARQVLGLINEKTQADSLKLILDKSSLAALEEACFKLAEKDRNGSSIIEKICDLYPSDKICSLLTSAMRNDIHSGANTPFHGRTALKTEMSHVGIKHAREGNYAKVEGIVKALPHVLYAVDHASDKSILEVAADAGHTPVVRLLIDQHKKVLERDISQDPINQSCNAISSIEEVSKVSAKDAAHMVSEYLSSNGYISHGDAKRILSNSHPTDRSLLIQSLETIYPEISTLSFLKYHSPSEKSTTAAEKYKQPSIPQQIGEKKSLTSAVTGSTTKALKDFGSLKSLASSIKNTIGDATGFKEKVLDSLNNERDFSKTSHKSGPGHNVFTIAAILGTPEQYDALLKRYSDKCSFWTKHPGYSASSHGTALQCAVKAGNSSMARHLLEKCDAEEISIQKGYDKENLLHTIVGSSNLDLLRVLPSASSPKKSSVHSKSVLKALLEKNAHNQTPIDLALTSGEQYTSALLSFISSSLKDSEIERLIGSENIVQTAIEHGNTQLLGWIFDTENRHNISVLASGKKKGKASSKQLQVLGNRNYELSLLRDACKSQNPDIAPFLLRKINERIQSSSVDEEASANISKLSKQALAYLVANNTYHPEVYSNLMELSQAQDPIKNEFFLKGAWQHDNADLIKHIPYQDIAQHLDKSALIKSGKDNLLSYCLENSTPAELENIDQDLKKALVESQGKMKKSRDFYAAWCADAELPAVLSEATLHSAILSGDLNRVKDLIAMDPTLIAKSQAGAAETGGDSNLLPYDFAVKKCANSKKHSELIKYLAKQSIDFALSEATAARGIAGVRADELISQEDWENFSHTVTRILATQGSALELDSMQLANLDGHLRDSASKLFEQSDESPSILRASLSSPKNYRVTSALLRHYLLHHDQLCQQQDPAEVEKIERQVANEINRVEDGHSLLHLAAMHGSYDTLEALLTLGGDKNISTSNRQNIAHLTARSGMLTPTDGEFVFEKLIRENPELNTKDKVGKGLLSYAASCIHPERTVAMLERIIASVPGDTEDRSADGVVLDANLAKYAKNSKKRNEYIKNELNRIDKNRSDNVLGDFLDEYFRDDSTTAAEHALSQLRKITSSSRKNNKKQLPHALERTSERSFTEINPIAGAVRYMSKDRHLLLEQQKKLFSICSQEALSGQDRDILRCVPMEAFTSRNPDYGFSPLDATIERENIPFIKEILEYRAEELPLNITNQNGDNIVIQLGKMLENPGVLRDKEFLELYKNLLDKSGCSTRSDSGIKAQYVLRNIGGVSGAELRNIADRAEHREVEIGEKFSDAINKVMEEASPNAVQHLSTLTRVYPNHARNAANPFAALLSNILLDKNTETNGISDNARHAIAAFLRDNTLRDTLKNVDAQGNNPLQSALKALVAEVGSPEIGQQRATALLEVCSDVASALEKKHKELLEEVFLKYKNYEGENFIESLTDVSPSFDIFRTLETTLTPEKISEHSDLNTILARSANQASLQNHICKNYSVFPIGDSDYRGKSRIHKAAVSGDHDAFMSVMVTGGNINLLDQDGNTPLHALLIHMLRNKDSNNIKPGHIETLKTLVAHGAPLHLKNKEGFSVCDLAKSIEHLPSPVKRSMFSFRRKKEDSCVDLVAKAHLQYHDLKEDVKKKVESNITWPSGIEKSTLSFCDLSGSKVAVKIGAGGVLTSSKLLHSKVFQENALSSANFDFGDGKDLGSVEKVGNKRNYTVQKGTIKLELSWKPSEGKTQKVQVDVLADGTVKVNDESIRECGAQGEKLNFHNCQVYIGGYSLAEALQRGRWREANQEIETSAPDIDPDGREHGLDRSPSPGNDERRELGAAALDDSIPYTSIPGSDGTALSSHAPSSRTSSISSTTDAGDDDYPSASAGRGQVVTVEAEVYDEEERPVPAVRGRDLGPHGGDGGARRTTPREPDDAPDSGDDDYPSASAGRGQVVTVEAEVYDEEERPVPAVRGRDLGPHGGDGGARRTTPREPDDAPDSGDFAARDGGASGRTTPIDEVPGQDGGDESRTPQGPADPIGRGGAVEPTPTITFPEDSDVADAEQRLAMPIRGFVPLPTTLSESEDESSSLGSRYNSDSSDSDDDFFSTRSTLTSPSPSLEDIAALAVEAQNMRDLSDRVVTPAPEDLAAGDGAGDRGISAPIDEVPGQDGGDESRTPQGPADPIGRGGAVEPTPTITFPEDSDVADAEQRLAMPIRGFVPLPTTLSESEDESSSLGSRYNSDSSDSDDDFFSTRSTLTSPSPSLEDIAALAVEAQNMRDLSDRVVTLAPEDLAAGDGAGDRGISAPIDEVPGQDGGVESKTPQEPAAALAPEDFAARDGAGDRGISAPIDEVPGQDGGARRTTPREPDDAPDSGDFAARDGGASGRTTPIDEVPGQDGGDESRTPQGPAALDRSILPVAPSSSTSRSPAVTQESVNLQKWHSILRMGMHAGCQFAMDLGNENDIGAIAQKCAEKYSALAKREDLQDPATRRATLKKEMRDVLGEFGIPNIPLNHGKLTIKNGNVQGLEDTMHFSSPYGFGEKIDGMIQAALRDVNEVARRANLNCEIRPNILSLPRIALAVNNMKDPRKGLALPSLGRNDDTPIPSRDAIRFLEGVSNLAMLEEKPKIVKESSISPDDPEARKVSRLIRYFSALANEEEGATAASIPHGTVQQNMLSDDDIEALRSTIEVIDAEREPVSQRQQMLHADLEAVLDEHVQEGTHSYDSIASTKSDTSIESADGASGDASYKPHFAALAVHGEATSVGDDTPDVFTASVEAHYILSDERHPKIVDSMLKMFSDSENDLPRCEMYSWAMLNKFSSIAGVNLAMHAKQPENVISAARYVFDSYKKAVDSKRSNEVTQEILKDRIPRALKRNYIDYVDVGDGTVNIENGAITGSPVDKVPAHFISPLGFGPYLDSVIIESAEDIAKIARRSTLNHSLSGLSKESLPALPVAVQQVTQDGGEYSRRFFNVPGDDSPIPQECGERILTHIGNICVAKGGTYNITPSDRPKHRVIIDGLAKDKIRAFNARADIDEQRESAIRQRQDANIALGASSTASMPARASIPEPAPDSEAAMMDFYYATGARPKRRSTTTKSSRSTSTRVVYSDINKVAEEVKKCADGMKGVRGGDDSSTTIATPGHSPIVSQASHQEGRSNR